MGIFFTAESYYTCVMKAISIKLPEPLFHDLAQRAKTSAASQSEIIRTALAAYLQRDSEGGVKGSPASCADRAQRWTGMMQGPADLSTHPKHLDGFGE